MASGSDLADRLAGVMAAASGDPGAIVEGLNRIPGGASRETWSFDLRRSDGTVEALILRRDPPGASRGAMTREAALITAARGVGMPVAPLVTVSDDPSQLGSSFLVVGRVEGETIPRRILREPALAGARAGLAHRCGQVLAALHSLPASAVAGLDCGDQVGQYRGMADQLGIPSPAFELAFRWLEDNRPPPVEPVVVHGDFRNGNLIVGPDGLRAVLDWELAHGGDPVEDLAWLSVKSWRFGSDLPVGGFGTYEQLFSGYREAGGVTVDPDRMRWWEVFGNLRWGVICMLQVSAHLSGAVRSVELAAIGRRVCEVEWDLLSLLPPPASSAVSSSPPPPPGAPVQPQPPPVRGLHGVPDAGGLLEAVRELLEGDLADATDGRTRFLVRVAANVLGMVERELALGPDQARAHAAALASLEVEDEAALAAAIRAGRLDDRSEQVRAFVAATVAARLAVANPRYT